MSLLQDLISAGLAEEQAKVADTVLKQYVAGEYVPKYRFDELRTKNKELSEEVARIETEKNSLEARAKKAEEDVAPLKEQISKVETDWQTKYKELEEQHAKEAEDRYLVETFTAKTNAINKLIGDSAYDASLVSSFIDFDNLDYDGTNVSGVEEALQKIKEEKPFLFKAPEQVKSTAPNSAPSDASSILNLGQALAQKANEAAAVTEAATQKYFGK